MPTVPIVADWQTDAHAQDLLCLLVAAGVAMHRQRVQEGARATGLKTEAGTVARVRPPMPTLRPESAVAGASHPALINHEMA